MDVGADLTNAPLTTCHKGSEGPPTARQPSVQGFLEARTPVRVVSYVRLCSLRRAAARPIGIGIGVGIRGGVGSGRHAGGGPWWRPTPKEAWRMTHARTCARAGA